jgi:hypothetical protein
MDGLEADLEGKMDAAQLNYPQLCRTQSLLTVRDAADLWQVKLHRAYEAKA